MACLLEGARSSSRQTIRHTNVNGYMLLQYVVAHIEIKTTTEMEIVMSAARFAEPLGKAGRDERGSVY